VKLDKAEPTGRRARSRSGSQPTTGYRQDEYYDDFPETDHRSSGAHQGSRKGRRSTGRITNKVNGRGRRSAKAGRGGAAERGRTAADSPRRASRTRKPKAVDRVSRFSASALRKVTVLGDRPEQVVYTLAEQSRQKHGTYVLITLLVLAVISLLALLAALVMQVLNPEAAANGPPHPSSNRPPGTARCARNCSTPKASRTSSTRSRNATPTRNRSPKSRSSAQSRSCRSTGWNSPCANPR